MKKVRIWFAAASAISLALVWFAARPTPVSFAAQHQEHLEEFIDLCRAEAKQHCEDGRLNSIYANYFRDTLVCMVEPHGYFFPALFELPTSTELNSAWQRIRSFRYFTAVYCSFEYNGAIGDTTAIEVHFAAEGKWRPYPEGNYCVCDCLVWRDAGYISWPLESWWIPLSESDGISTTSEGSWYYSSSHKHYDG